MGTGLDGSSVEVRGCDLFQFRDGKIALKNSYRKNRPAMLRLRDALPGSPLATCARRLVNPQIFPRTSKMSNTTKTSPRPPLGP